MFRELRNQVQKVYVFLSTGLFYEKSSFLFDYKIIYNQMNDKSTFLKQIEPLYK